MTKWQPVIGMEIHVQLQLHSKLFSLSPLQFGAAPNTLIEAVDVGMPGALPVVQRAAIEAAIRLGLALEATIAPVSRFARKHYAYADLPKGYQITQGEPAIISQGRLPIVDGDEVLWVPIHRAHLEEDAGKSSHTGALTLLDYNRSGTPLIEVVTAPVLSTPQQAMMTFRSLRQLVMALGICDGNLQEGSMRADANVSVHREGEPLGTRVELKNINSPRFLHDAVAFEINRQTTLRERGEGVIRETRLWDVHAQQSRAMRQKEDAFDYRLMPEPDVPPMVVDEAWRAKVAQTQPLRPHDHRIRLREAGVAHAAVEVVLDDAALLTTLDALAAAGVAMPLAARVLVNELMGMGADAHLRIGVAPLAAVLRCHEQGLLSGKHLKQAMQSALDEGLEPMVVVDRDGLRTVQDDAALRDAVMWMAEEHAATVQQVKAGQGKLKGFLVGVVLKRLGGKADPKAVAAAVDKVVATE